MKNLEFPLAPEANANVELFNPLQQQPARLHLFKTYLAEVFVSNFEIKYAFHALWTNE